MENAEIISVEWADAHNNIDFICVYALTVTMSVNGVVSTENACKRYAPGGIEWVIGDIILRDDDSLYHVLTERVAQLSRLDVTNLQFAGCMDEHGRKVEIYTGAVCFLTPRDLHYTEFGWWVCYEGEGEANILDDELQLVTEARNNIIENCHAACERYCRDRIIVLEIIGDLAQVIHEYLMAMFSMILEPTHFVFGNVTDAEASDQLQGHALTG